ncbi:MAG: tyrosine-type recombinase/integrase [Nanoarchaeota archaeon]|nr:tyrosine-type recombinase/integrase [Nanoarchaeota archaeon]MBU1135513.1 tyrosine-type recombinase/integrase [Nanoarchaeota archaeon]MBU2520303.1 tyrosine-type recombinase/integrase [Nanoarchaeota archaeon]
MPNVPPGPLIYNFGSTSTVLSLPFSNDREDKDWDIYNTKAKYLKQLEQINSWNTSDSNKDLIQKFLKRTEIEGVGVVQRLKYLYAFKTFLRFVSKDFQAVTEQDLEHFLLSMNSYAEKTKRTRWYCIRKLLTFLEKEELFNKIKPRFKVRKLKLPEELLTLEEVNKMISRAYHIRDKAFLSALYETGCRAGEILSRRIKHVAFDNHGAVLTVSGKTDSRRVRIIRSVALLANWIENHPIKDNPKSFLWISLNNYKNPVQYRTMDIMIKNLAERCNIKKRVYMHLFRHTRSTHLANKLTEAQMKEYLGWTQRSEMASIYVHLSGRDVDQAIIEMNEGKTSINHVEPTETIKECFRCGAQSHPSSKFCSHCGLLLDETQIANKDQINSKDF